MSKRQRLVLLAGLSSLTTSVVFGETRCPDSIETIRYHSLHHSQIGLPVMVNGLGPFEFLLDTGSQMTIVDPSLAAELQLSAVGRAGVVSDVRRGVVEMVRLDRLEAGSTSVGQALAVVQNLAQIQSVNPTVRGILGENFLAHFDLLIDHGHNVLCLDAAGSMQKDLQGERIPFVIKSDAEWDSPVPQPFLIPVQIAEQSRKMILRLDSGANVPQLYVNTLDTAPWMQRQSALRGAVTGKTAEYFALMPPRDIHIGKQVVRDLVFATPLKTAQNVSFKGEDGLLPTALFKRVLISYRSQFVIMNPR